MSILSDFLTLLTKLGAQDIFRKSFDKGEIGEFNSLSLISTT